MLRRSALGIGFSLAMAAMAASPAGAQQTAGISDNVVRIGILADMSGVFSDLSGAGSVAAAKLAVEDFKKKHNPAFGIELVIGDHQNKTDIAVNIARDWYDNKKVDMITDAINSAVAIAASKVATEKDRLLIVTGSGSTKINNEECSKNTLLYAWNTYSFAALPATYLTRKGHKKWFFIGIDYAFGHSLQADATTMIKQEGGEVVGAVHYPLGTSDFTSYVLQAQSSNADVVALASAGAGLLNSLRTAKDFGLDKTKQLTIMGGSFDDVVALGTDVAQGLLIAEGFYWDFDEESRAWSAHFEAATGKKPSMLNAGLYSAIMQYLAAVSRTGTDTAKDVIADIRSQKSINDVFLRNAHLRDDNLMSHDVYLLEVKKPSESKGKWDVYKVIATASGEEAFGPISQSKCPLVKQ